MKQVLLQKLNLSRTLTRFVAFLLTCLSLIHFWALPFDWFGYYNIRYTQLGPMAGPTIRVVSKGFPLEGLGRVRVERDGPSRGVELYTGNLQANVPTKRARLMGPFD